MKQISIKQLVYAIVIMLGLASIALAVIAGGTFKSSALKSQKETLQRILDVSSQGMLEKLEEYAAEIGSTAQRDPVLKSAIQNDVSLRDEAIEHLDDQFSQSVILRNRLQLQSMRVFDTDLKLVMKSTEGSLALSREMPPLLRTQAQGRTGADRLKSVHALWNSGQEAHYSMLVPIGGLRLMGYLEVVLNPVSILQTLEQKLRAPLMITSGDTVLFQSESWDEEKAHATLPVSFDLQNQLNEQVMTLTMLEDMSNLYQSIDNTNLMMLTSFVIIILIAVVLAQIFLSRLLFTPLGTFTRALQSCAQGDLSVSITQTKLLELQILGDSLNQLMDSLKNQVEEIQNNTESVTKVSREVDTIVNTLNTSSNELRDSVEQTTTSIDAISELINLTSDNAENTNKLAQEAAQQTAQGEAAVTQTVEAMREIARQVSQVEEIAYKTNILALNASIEAARANEHGRGFSVVAEEVRKLAGRSQQLAREIADSASNSVNISEHAGKLLKEITPNIERTAHLVKQIYHASTEQRKSANLVSTSIHQLEQVAHTNAQASDKLSAASNSLNSESDKLTSIVKFFRL
ncbi:MAG: methyl-accepting chemotaxis protein [Gammaproteobacteria bacterium]|nr:methyl-accepting chemotaxis protein [Gammaproteobacteria bacterium]